MKRNSLAIGMLMGVLGFAGNWLRLELFFNVDFLFGSFFVMLAILRYGGTTGILAAVIADVAAFLIWHHPWAMVVHIVEALFIVRFSRRDDRSLLSIDMLYWLCCGAPLLWFFYQPLMGMNGEATLLIVLKQSINGVFNAFLATIVHLLLQAREGKQDQLPPLRQIVFVSTVALVLVPLLIHVLLDGRKLLEDEQALLARATADDAALTVKILSQWVREHQEDVQTLAQLVGDPNLVPQIEMQHDIALVMLKSPNILRMGVFDRNAVTRAYLPLTDARGRSSIGRDFSDRPYLPLLRRTSTPYVSNVLTGRIATGQPFITFLAPIRINGSFRGFCSGVFDTGPIREQLAAVVGTRDMHLTVVDRQRRVVVSTRPDLSMMSLFSRASAPSVRKITAGTGHWRPVILNTTAAMEQGGGSEFIREIRLAPGLGWTVICESSLLPLLHKVHSETNRALLLLAILLVGTIALSRLLSNGLVDAISRLQSVTQAFPLRLPAGEGELAWPKSRIREMAGLIANFHAMADSLTGLFVTQKVLNETLEQRVHQEQQHLKEKELLVKDLHDGIGGIVTNIAMLGELGLRQQQLEGSRETLRKIVSLASDGVTEVRSFMNSIEGGGSSWHDLIAELRDYGEKMLEPHGIELTVSADIAGNGWPLTTFRYVNIIRICREAITNIVKHARATRVTISLQVTPAGWQLTVADNGVGFDPSAITKRGLANMLSRAQEIGADLKISRTEETQVRLTVAVEEE